MKGNRAVFVDRDGVLNDLVYDKEEGHAGSPFSASEMRIFPYVAPVVKELRDAMGFEVIVVSNQPGVAKGQFSLSEFGKMKRKLERNLARAGTAFDGQYYCLHHPHALRERYRVDCDCRKPKPGMILRAAQERGIDLANSYFVGDSLADVKAGREAGCTTILVGQATTFLTRMMEREEAVPDYMAGSLKDVPGLLAKLESPRPGRRRSRQ